MILFIYNFIQPVLFRYGIVKCSANLVSTKSCGDDCISYDYELKYRDICGDYNINCRNTDGCKLSSDLRCEIMEPRYGKTYLSLITDSEITISNIFNALVFSVGIIVCIIILINNIVLKETTQIN